MFERAIAGAKLAFRLQPPGRNLTVFPDDAFLVSYPKSGNTWARFLIACVLRPGQTVGFANINEIIPGADVVRHRDLLRMPRPRIVKSHQYFDPRYRRVIYIVRDPRDVAVSQYHFQRKRGFIADDYLLEDFVDDFVAGRTCDYASWGEHVASWISTRSGQTEFLLLRYEDMLRNTVSELSRIVSFLRLDTTPEVIREAVLRSSADKMRQMEKSQAQSFNGTRNTRQDITFVRAASSGGWRANLPGNSVAKIESAWGPLINYLGYELTTRPVSANSATLFNVQEKLAV